MRAAWYFDPVSPYAYLHFKLFDRIVWPDGVAPQIEYVPVLFAGLLKAHGMKGPAEIAEKRRHTYRMCVWLAQKHGIALRLPPAHPFNPLHALRLLIGAAYPAGAVTGPVTSTVTGGPTRTQVEAVFDCIWRDGNDVNAPAVFAALARQLGVDDAQSTIARPEVKQQLTANTERAVQRGVYGVPTFGIDDQLFWGSDTLALMNAWLADAALFTAGEMARIDALPAAAVRKEAA